MKIQTLITERKKLSTVSSNDSLATALEKMRSSDIKSIPVVNGNKFIGIIFKDKILEMFLTDRDTENKLNETKVEALIEEIPVLTANHSFEFIVHTLREKDVVFVAINDEKGNFIGIITHKSIFDELTDIIGLNNGKKLSIYLYDIPGQLAKISQVFARHNANIQNLLVRNPKTKLTIKEIILRVDDSVAEYVKEDLEKAGYRVELA
ncbi:CBS domain-containing protein [Clostridium thermarum]|uniref:CBS domain-containing protein n=1 Tax=Clostridium thermarum TaxID=1716543 RepID=UPI0013D77458|nr:CBS domain-containing protein [Clostridium thermarum]